MELISFALISEAGIQLKHYTLSLLLKRNAQYISLYCERNSFVRELTGNAHQIRRRQKQKESSDIKKANKNTNIRPELIKGQSVYNAMHICKHRTCLLACLSLRLRVCAIHTNSIFQQ